MALELLADDELNGISQLLLHAQPLAVVRLAQVSAYMRGRLGEQKEAALCDVRLRKLCWFRETHHAAGSSGVIYTTDDRPVLTNFDRTITQRRQCGAMWAGGSKTLPATGQTWWTVLVERCAGSIGHLVVGVCESDGDTLDCAQNGWGFHPNMGQMVRWKKGRGSGGAVSFQHHHEPAPDATLAVSANEDHIDLKALMRSHAHGGCRIAFMFDVRAFHIAPARAF